MKHNEPGDQVKNNFTGKRQCYLKYSTTGYDSVSGDL